MAAGWIDRVNLREADDLELSSGLGAGQVHSLTAPRVGPPEHDGVAVALDADLAMPVALGAAGPAHRTPNGDSRDDTTRHPPPSHPGTLITAAAGASRYRSLVSSLVSLRGPWSAVSWDITRRAT